MEVHIVDKNLVITTEPKTYNKKHTIKNEVRELLSKYRHGSDIHDPSKQ